MDQHVHKAISTGLRECEVDVLTAFEDGSSELDDLPLLACATELNRVLFTHDTDFLVIARQHQLAGLPFSGTVFAHQTHVAIAVCIDNLEIIAKLLEPHELEGQVIYLPL